MQRAKGNASAGGCGMRVIFFFVEISKLLGVGATYTMMVKQQCDYFNVCVNYTYSTFMDIHGQQLFLRTTGTPHLIYLGSIDTLNTKKFTCASRD